MKPGVSNGGDDKGESAPMDRVQDWAGTCRETRGLHFVERYTDRLLLMSLIDRSFTIKPDSSLRIFGDRPSDSGLSRM